MNNCLHTGSSGQVAGLGKFQMRKFRLLPRNVLYKALWLRVWVKIKEEDHDQCDGIIDKCERKEWANRTVPLKSFKLR